MTILDDIESYSLVCWQIHDLGPQIILEHRRLRKQFTSIGNSVALAGEPKGTRYLEDCQLVELVSGDPVHTLYIKNLNINGWQYGFETEQEFEARLSGSGLRPLLASDEGPWFKPCPKSTLRVFKKAIRDPEN